MSLRDIFWWAANVDKKVLEQCPEIDQNRYCSLGATMFIAASLAAMSFSYAVYLFLNPISNDIDVPTVAVIAAIISAPVWATFIFHIDRTVVSAINPYGTPWIKVKRASLRLLLSVTVSIVVAHPLMLCLFSEDIRNNYMDEIQPKIKEDTANRISQLHNHIADLKKERNSKKDLLEREFAALQTRKNVVENKLTELGELKEIQEIKRDCEATGKTLPPCEHGSGIAIKGQKYNEYVARVNQIGEDIDRLTNELNSIIEKEKGRKEMEQEVDQEIQNINTEIGNLESELNTLVDSKVDEKVERISFFQRSDHFIKLLHNSNHLAAIMIGIFLMLVSIELSPVLLKVIFPIGEYEKQLEYRAREQDHMLEIRTKNLQEFSESAADAFDYAVLVDRVKVYINELEEMIIDKMKQIHRKIFDDDISVDSMLAIVPHARVIDGVAKVIRTDINGNQLSLNPVSNANELKTSSDIEPEPQQDSQTQRTDNPRTGDSEKGPGFKISKRDLYSLAAATIFAILGWIIITRDSADLTIVQQAQFFGACWIGSFTVLEGIFWRKR